MNKSEQQKYQAQDDAYTMARYQEIMSDKGRAARAAKVCAEQAKNFEAQARNMKSAPRVRTVSRTKKK